MSLLTVVGDVINERARQDEQWGEQNHADFPWVAILTEEVGEVAQAALHRHFGGKACDLRAELIQVAAVAVAFVEAIDRRQRSDAHEFGTHDS